MKKILTYLISVLTISSCAKEISPYEDLTGPVVIGKVTDQEGNPVEHIQVTLDWAGEENADRTVVFTSSEGTFKSYAILSSEGHTALDVILEDIDGEKNGGMFETLTETVVLYENEAEDAEEQIRFELVFRLNHATASENSPQS